ncbi:MAG: response regulator transcription factor [bacterium]|nr:response regulator transcription factor [bacterium]
MRALLVDDDADFLTFVTIALESHGVSYETASSAVEALEVLDAKKRTFDLILLDIEMPGPTGWDVLLELREKGNEVPVIFVSGREKVEDRVKSLKLGADDYLVKPIQVDELHARMEAVLRRRHSLAPLEFGDLQLDLARRRAVRNGKPAHLSPREFDLLLALTRAEGKVVSRQDLLREVWDMDFDPGTNVLDVHIGRVRKKIDRHGRPLIKTVRGEGYCLTQHESEEQ